jgi:hypothetical protein
MSTARSKIRKFQFSVPLTTTNKKNGLFSIQQVGQLWITARAVIDAESMPFGMLPTEQPLGVRITLEEVKYMEVDILPLTQQAEWKTIEISLMKAAYNNLCSILNNE